MLRYRERLGLLPPTHHGIGHRRYGDEDLRAAALAIAIESRYDVGPTAVAFALRALAEPEVAARVRELGERTGRITPTMRALDFDTQKALRLLRRSR
jgi:DNA-binding transcriptional MerR regulator